MTTMWRHDVLGDPKMLNNREKKVLDAVPWDDDLEVYIDDDGGLPQLSHAEGGTWVAAWVWVPDDESPE